MKKRFLIFVLVFWIQNAVAGVLPMRHFSVDEGLVNNEVLTLYQDSKGYLWFGTYEGLSRFDGKEFRNFTEENTNLAGSIIRSITEDAQGNLWVGFIGGIARMSGNTFFNYGESDGLTGNDVICLFPDPKAGLWILTDQGVNYFDGEKFSFYLLDGINTEVYAPMLTGSPDGEIFVIDKYGLSHKRPDQTQFENLMQLSGGIRALKWHNDALYILTASELYKRQGANLSAAAKTELEEILDTLAFGKGGVWIASVSEIFQPETETKYTNEMLAEPAITNILEDREGNLWVASWSGVSMIVNAGIINYNLPFKTVTAISEADGNIWAAGDKGLVKLDPDGGLIKYIESPFVEYMAICGDTLFSCTEDMLTLYNFNGEIIKEIEGESYTAIHQTADFIWLGSYNGLYRMSPEEKPKKFIDSGTGLGSNTVWAVYQDKKGRLWVGTENGLSMMWNDSWSHYTTENSALPHNSVWTITEHEKWGVLFATTGGIAVWKDGKFETLPQLSGKMVDNLLIDSDSRLWAGSTKGVYRFSQGGADDIILDRSRGLPANQMYFRTITEIGNQIYVGSSKGLTRINAGIQNDRTASPLMEITGVSVNQEPIAPAKLNAPLKHDRNNLTFEFSAIYTYLPESVVYSYHLSGMDKEWRSDVLRKVTYTNIPPGKYKFQVQALAEAGKKSAVRSVEFTILKPFWLEWWFIALEILAGLIFVALVAQLVSRIRLKKSEAEKARLQALYDKQLELDALKDDFLANTSHELRTPLNGIIGITDSLLDGAGGDVPPLIEKNLIMVSSSGKRLLRLVNDILDFSTLKKREMVLEPEPVDVHQITESVLNLSQGLIGDKPLKLINAVSPHLPMAHADSAKLEQVLINLVGNAIKFTNTGHVKVSAALDPEGLLQVQVEDTGLGIVAEKLESIFEAFEQVESHETRKFEGTGIGLSITKQIVELHGGKIWAESEPGRGAVFFFTLPVTSESAPKQTAAAPKPEAPEESEPVKEFDGRRVRTFNPPPAGIDERRKEIQVLAVDDEPTNLQVISNYLTPVNVAVTKALNGMEALELLESGFKPDCILLDVMMPKMSGFEVCEKIRETHPAAELPIIILTAKNQTSDLVKGFQAGASDYLTKPFVKDELLARIKTHTDLIRIVDKLIASTADREAINKELEVARRIQMNFLPKDFFSDRSEFELHAIMQPAKQVGGDLYDFFFLTENRFCFVIGDVSDKGVPAALFMVTAKTLIKAIADNPDFHEPARLVSELNRILNWDNPRSMFITLIVAVIDLETGAIDYCNGGHNPPLYLGANGGDEYLKAKSGPFVGPFAGLQYKPLQHSLKPGEALLFYTDGVTEAINPDKAEFGEDQLTAVAAQSKAGPVEEIIKAVISKVQSHAGDEPQSDDITMLAIRYNGPGETE